MMQLVHNTGRAPATRCSVTMDGEAHSFDDFVVIGSKNGYDFEMLHYTDAVGLMVAIRMLTKAYNKMYNDLEESDQRKVEEFFALNPGRT